MVEELHKFSHEFTKNSDFYGRSLPIYGRRPIDRLPMPLQNGAHHVEWPFLEMTKIGTHTHRNALS